MKKNLLIAETAESIINRVKALKPYARSLWGDMTVTEMLAHCNSYNSQLFSETRDDTKTTVRQYLLRIQALYISPKLMKGQQTTPRHITQGKISPDDFEQERNKFIALIKQFPLTRTPLTLTHPAFGNLSTRQWGIAAYKHVDHHLRQFGV